MDLTNNTFNRRSFLKTTAAVTTGTLGLSLIPNTILANTPTIVSDSVTNVNCIGPKDGYTPQVGTLVSMLNWMRMVVLHSVKDMSQKDLDYLHDEKSNTIGAMLFHLAATERLYQVQTLEGKEWGAWSEKDKLRFDAASELGDIGRKTIKGNNLNFYVDTLTEVRENTLAEFKKRDDKWLMTEDTTWPWTPSPTNNYCKWFHVCEHESNHNGQIKYIKGRLPGAKKED
ncbi:MAG TPA: DUF664 domain-containing protein [Bacteroidia bacterium]|jgi:hypothetical protein|nr:DUF664 domain-containing protein [Bacteroidia bacterium]